MKKQRLTKQDIQQDLLSKLNEGKGTILFFTVMTIVSIIAYIAYAVGYASGIYYESNRGFRGKIVSTEQVLVMMPVVLAILVAFLLYAYYIDLFKIKTGKFEIVEAELLQKAKESVHYYRKTRSENALYFPTGRTSVEREVYEYSKEGDRFYIVILNTKKKTPRLAYHTRYYEIEKGG